MAAAVDPFAPPIVAVQPDGGVIVRHRSGRSMQTTLWLIDGDEVRLRFGLAGVYVASLTDGRFKVTAKTRGMAMWHIDAGDLERLRETANDKHDQFAERIREARYGT